MELKTYIARRDAGHATIEYREARTVEVEKAKFAQGEDGQMELVQPAKVANVPGHCVLLTPGLAPDGSVITNEIVLNINKMREDLQGLRARHEALGAEVAAAEALIEDYELAMAMANAPVQ